MFFSFYYLFALIFVLTFHEFSHAWAASRLGDPTPQRAGRLSLNPLHHLDLVGTLMLFLAGFGWGKPVPVDPRNFERPLRDEALTALAGPSANLVLAFLFAIPYSYVNEIFVQNLSGAILDLSLVLFVFNMLPFPPLDGSKFYTLFFPERYKLRYRLFLEHSTAYFIAFMIMDMYLSPRILGFSIVWEGVSTATFWLKTAILVIV